MASKSGGSWKNERASVHKAGQRRSNKYRPNDSTKRPEPHTASRAWVGGYVRADGTRVKGHYRASATT